MKELLDLFSKIGELRDKVVIDNTTDDDLVDAYNEGVDAMANQIRGYINLLALQTVFNGGEH